ncbi:uncharacterized protein [Macrobrachium rosenbergii]|uniref:uncharacterized protein n=1 Tax=Macrobrachium rosenbergii TaxID=79674 RepID=UPI0034D67FBD
MARLDEKFGNVTKVVDSVLCEIRALKPVPEGNNKKLVELVNTVERGWLDMCKLDLKSEINNTTVISLVEKLLPPTLKREWVLKASESQSEKEFGKLLEFLEKERKVVEYVQEGVRSSTTADRAAVHSATHEDRCYSDNLNEAIKQLRENQESQQQQLNECTEWTIEACGINEITSDITEFDTTLIAKLFGVEEWKICRPTGKGVARKLNVDEISNYNGPVHYLPHHEIHKPDSVSTPLRIVFNSSSSYFGHVLNDYFAKGPDVLNNMIAILIRFRQHAVAIIADIKKMYNSVRISELDQHTHRFLWQDLETDREPDHYVLTTVTFGDRPSGIMAMMALRKTTEMDESFPLTAEMINRNSYVDDILSSVSMVERAKRSIVEANAILSRGGFQIKQWVMSGESPEDNFLNILKTDKEKVLGLNWNPKEDLFFYVIKINFSKKVKNIRMEPPIKKSEINEKLPNTLNRRMVLSQTASVYDPLGFIVPFTLKAKLLMRDLLTTISENERRLDWDEAMPQYMYERWRKLFKEMYELETLTFHRCVKPKDAVGKPDLVIFADASKLAYGACAYLRWKVREGPFVSKLLMAKNRIAPTRQLTIPRLELCGAVLACQLRTVIEKEIDIELESVIHIIDSSIVRAQICNKSSSFNIFVATRVAEIQTKSKSVEWFWTSSRNNPADLTTRPTHPMLLDSDSSWQNGPPFIGLPVSEWPISQSNDLELPDIAPVKIVNNLYDLKVAEDIWVGWVQKTIADDWEKRYERLGAVMNEEGLICVGQRISVWLKDNWNRSTFVLLPVRHSFTRLYVKHIHEIDHAGVEVTLAKLQSKFWVPGARKLIKSVKARCVICRKLAKKTEEQCMGQCPSERLQPAPPFFNTAIDLFGPFIVKDTVKRRTRKKVYGIIFNCMVSRAVYLDLAEGYDTENFLMTLRRFVCIRGFPKRMHSDGGTQLVAANKELRTMARNWNMTQISEFGSVFGMSWTFNKSADAPWENGCSESLIKSVKRCITMSVGTNILQTCMFEIANLMNSRPIGLKPGFDPSLGIYLCPNDLLLGHTGVQVPSGLWDESNNPRQSFQFMQKIVNSFWKRWQRDYFSSLLVRQKWHTQHRNLRPGDIVLIQENNIVKGAWKMAEVAVAVPRSDGQVRDVTLRYKVHKPGSQYKGQTDMLIKRSAHRLIVLLPVEERGEC